MGRKVLKLKVISVTSVRSHWRDCWSSYLYSVITVLNNSDVSAWSGRVQKVWILSINISGQGQLAQREGSALDMWHTHIAGGREGQGTRSCPCCLLQQSHLFESYHPQLQWESHMIWRQINLGSQFHCSRMNWSRGHRASSVGKVHALQTQGPEPL